MRRRSLQEAAQKNVSLELSFAWLFLSGLYYQFFVENQKRKMSAQDFFQRLKNTEFVCGAGQPRLNSLKPEHVEGFKRKYYFLAKHPYELTCPRVGELSQKELKSIYSGLKRNQISFNKNSRCLDKNVQFWLKQRVYWKESFLKELYNSRDDLAKKHKEFMPDEKDMISSGITQITGKNFPFPEDNKSKEVVVVPGEINFNEITYLEKEADIGNCSGRYVAVSTFPASYIYIIPSLKGLILQEGSEFSHIAATCREFNIPCRISPIFFKEQQKTRGKHVEK